MHQFYIYIGLGALALILFIYNILIHIRLRRITRECDDTIRLYNELSVKYAVADSKLSDMANYTAKIEAEKQSWQNTATELERNLSTLKASFSAREENTAEKIQYLEKIKEDLTLKFKNISSEIIKSQHETFTTEQKNTLSIVLEPFAEQLKAFKTEVTTAREESIKNKSSLDEQLKNLLDLNHNLSKDAQSLTEALKGGKKAQGNWGECQLERILEISGLRKDIDYETQNSYTDENKKLFRPDVIIHLPEKRDIIVDSKVSLNDYLEAVNTEDEDTRIKCLQKNVACIKSHIDELSAKEYQKLLKDRTLNYVIMFIPVESAYIAALDADRFLYDYAYKRNIILATPLSLLPTLRTIQNLWQIDNQNQNVQKIAEIGGKIYDKLAAFVEDMRSIERGLNQANNAYNNAITKISGRGGALSQAENMKKLGAKTNKIINLTLNDNELLLNHEQNNYSEISESLTLSAGETNA